MVNAYEEPSLDSKESLYQSLSQIVSKELPRQSVDPSGGTLGSGAFGEVFRGTYTDKDGSVHNAAIKMLRPEAGSKEHVEFLREAAIMGQWDHNHIIKLYGYVTVDDPPMIVIEIADGSLSDRLSREACSNDLLVRWAHETCLAMCYLSARSYIHRDLACRNVLLISDSARIADFGRSRQLEADIYDAKPGIVPIRWTAPEALTHGKYSSASDVWSFGVLLYEMWTRGAMPYDATWSNGEVYERVRDGYRLPPPAACPTAVYGLMIRCWHAVVARRVSFRDIESSIRATRHSKAAMDDVHAGSEDVARLWTYTATGVAAVTASGAAGVVYESSTPVPDDDDSTAALPVRPIYSVVDKHRVLPGAADPLGNEYVEIPALTRGTAATTVPSRGSEEYAQPADSLRSGAPPTAPTPSAGPAMERGNGTGDFMQLLPAKVPSEGAVEYDTAPPLAARDVQYTPLSEQSQIEAVYDPSTGEAVVPADKGTHATEKKRSVEFADDSSGGDGSPAEKPSSLSGAPSNRLQKRTSKWLDEWNTRKATVGKKGGAGAAAEMEGGGDGAEGACKDKKSGKSLFKRLGGKKKDKG
eukprot:m.401577 g.401577  ORF g.401577 m.401577 type:complete len:584 (-) comp21169_c0_seq3:293-2044(-)